jgi:hypothetical protein
MSPRTIASCCSWRQIVLDPESKEWLLASGPASDDGIQCSSPVRGYGSSQLYLLTFAVLQK